MASRCEGPTLDSEVSGAVEETCPRFAQLYWANEFRERKIGRSGLSCLVSKRIPQHIDQPLFVEVSENSICA